MVGFHFEQVDTVGHQTNNYFKFIKFGFVSMTELCSDTIRHDLMSREETVELVNEHDCGLDPIILEEDFCKLLGINEE